MSSSQHHGTSHVRQLHKCYSICLIAGVIFSIALFLLLLKWWNPPLHTVFTICTMRNRNQLHISSIEKTGTWQTLGISVVKNNVIFWIVSNIMKKIIHRWLNRKWSRLNMEELHKKTIDFEGKKSWSIFLFRRNSCWHDYTRFLT